MATDFKHYLIEIGRYPLLSASEEQDLARAYKNGDADAREQLICSNLRLVVYIAKAYKSKVLTLEDLVMEGNSGLYTAVEKFNPELGYRFSTCATPWIKQAILKAITDKSKAIRLPAHIYQLINKMKTAIAELEDAGYDDPTDEQVAEKMGVDVEKVKSLQDWKQDTQSIDTPLGDDTEDTVLDTIADDTEAPAEYTERRIKEERIEKLIAALPERTQIIIKMRYGIGEWRDNDHTLEEIGEYVGLTRERVRQIEQKTIRDWKAQGVSF